MGAFGFNSANNKYPQKYLGDIEKYAFKRMDSKENGGNGDGKVDIKEGLQDLQECIFGGISKDSSDYKKLKAATANLPEILAKYAGSDGQFSAKEWAELINGKEWHSVLDTLKSTHTYSQWEMKQIDNSHIKDGLTTKGELKVSLFNQVLKSNPGTDFSEIEAIIDKYAGDDGTFTLSEYMALKNNPQYQAFIKKYHLTPFG